MSDYENFEDFLRSLAGGLGESFQHKLDDIDIDGVSASFGVNPDQAREWVDGAAAWMRTQFEARTPFEAAASRTAATRPEDDPLRAAAPHPLDLPTDEQGVALAALDSGRWTVEPGANKLGSRGDGPGPSDALGLVRELRARDWIAADGEVTLAGRHALSRWLDAATSR
jgi:hypothetical protein